MTLAPHLAVRLTILCLTILFTMTGCNSAGANYTAEGDRLTIDAMITTKRACIEAAGNELERAYVSAMERTRRFRIVNGQLELLDDGGTVLARFR